MTSNSHRCSLLVQGCIVQISPSRTQMPPGWGYLKQLSLAKELDHLSLYAVLEVTHIQWLIYRDTKPETPFQFVKTLICDPNSGVPHGIGWRFWFNFMVVQLLLLSNPAFFYSFKSMVPESTHPYTLAKVSPYQTLI